MDSTELQNPRGRPENKQSDRERHIAKLGNSIQKTNPQVTKSILYILLQPKKTDKKMDIQEIPSLMYETRKNKKPHSQVDIQTKPCPNQQNGRRVPLPLFETGTQ